MAQVNLKEQLVDAATDLFHRQGYNASSVDDIVRAAHVPKGSFYNHFESKEALGLEVVRRYAASTPLDMLTASGVPALDRLRAHLERMVERTVGWGVGRGCVLGNFATELASQSPVITAAVRESFAAWSAALVPVIAELPGQTDPQSVADYIVNGLEGAYARAKVTGERQPLDQFLAVTFATVLR
jgi:TetR/AcrR family transcriptional repressor of nem operon